MATAKYYFNQLRVMYQNLFCCNLASNDVSPIFVLGEKAKDEIEKSPNIMAVIPDKINYDGHWYSFHIMHSVINCRLLYMSFYYKWIGGVRHTIFESGYHKAKMDAVRSTLQCVHAYFFGCAKQEIYALIDTKYDNSLDCGKEYPKTYLMHDSNTGYTKIGKSVNPRQRERTLQSEKPTITMFAVCDRLVERELHTKYADKRIRGEWFDLTDTEVQALISDYGFNDLTNFEKGEI